jgi:hypothetical protein
MLPLYLFCLIVGGGVLLVTLLGSDSEGAGDGDGAGHDPDSPAAHGVLASEFLSIRSLFHFLAAFGATGLLIEALTAAAPGTALLWAILAGTAGAAVAAALYGWMRRSESGLVPRDGEYLVGLAAQVRLPVTAGQRGKVVALHDGREIELLARLHTPGEADCPFGTSVVIVEVEGDTALVAPLPTLLPESS